MTTTPEPQSSPENNQAHPERQQGNPVASRRGKSIVFILLLFTALILFSRHEAIHTIDCTPEIIARNPDIIMLGAWWCSYCYRAKEYFQQNKINYCEYDMENTEAGKRLYQKHGGGLPVLLIGKYQLNGFSEQQIEQALSMLEK